GHKTLPVATSLRRYEKHVPVATSLRRYEKHVPRRYVGTSLRSSQLRERNDVATCNDFLNARRWAEFVDHALLTFRCSGNAHLPAMMNERVAQPGPLQPR